MKRYRATRLVSWRVNGKEVNAAPGEPVEAPAAVIKDFLSVGAIEEVNDG